MLKDSSENVRIRRSGIDTRRILAKILVLTLLIFGLNKRMHFKVRTIKNIFHYTFKLQKPILCALAKAGKEGLSAEKVWEQIGVNDKFLCKEKKRLFVEFTRSLLCMMKGEKLVESCETPNGTVWKIPDEKSDHQTK